MDRKEKVRLVLDRLGRIYPYPKTFLNYSNVWELLVATILSAQTTDKLVNLTTKSLFKEFKTIKDFAGAPLESIDKEISKVNFHRNKAKFIKSSAEIILTKFKGKVPDNMDDLDSLPGVARKTANVVLGNAFKKNEGITVDTHVARLAKKLGLTNHSDPVKIEKDLMGIVAKDKWTDFSHLLINYGRDFCPARPHACGGVLSDLYTKAK